jgi:hypothetical protein
MQTGQIIRIFNHGTKMQMLCADERGLVSVYFDRKPFYSFFRAIKRAGLKLNGLQINFDRNAIRVPALSKDREFSTQKRPWFLYICLETCIDKIKRLKLIQNNSSVT